jgi:dienelactone hydrolase
MQLVVLMAVLVGGCSSGEVAPPDIVDTWSPPPEAAGVAPLSCEEIVGVFAYDPQALLDIREVSRHRDEGVTVSDLTYASPMGGRIPATLVIPDGNGPFAGMLYQHGMPSTRQPLIPGAVTYARMGAVVLLIDAPFARRANGLNEPLTFTDLDRREQIQLIVDLRRGIDLLLSRPEVDRERLAYVGISYGGAMGGLLAGVEDRLQAYVLQVGDGGLVTHSTGPEDTGWWRAQPAEVRQEWVAAMWPIEPVHYVGCAAPAALLFQNGALDELVPPADALRYQEAGSEPKTVRWYAAGHGLGEAAGRDQAEWLSEMIGISVRRPLPRSVATTIAGWSLLVAVSLGALILDMWRLRPAPHGARLMWILTTLFLGPLGLLIYWVSGRRLLEEAGTSPERPAAWRALGSAAWGAAGNMVGGVGVLALLLYFPALFDARLVLQIAAVFLVPFGAGWLILILSRRLSRHQSAFGLAYRRTLFAEVVSTCWVLAGAYPTVNILIGRCFDRWTAPFGFDLSYPPLWGALCLAGVAATLLTFPFHLWMIRRGVIAWGVAPAALHRGPVWYWKAALMLLSFAAMLGAIFLSMQIA